MQLSYLLSQLSYKDPLLVLGYVVDFEVTSRFQLFVFWCTHEQRGPTLVYLEVCPLG